MAPALYQFTPLSSASSVRLLRLTDPIASQGFTESAGIELFEVPIEDAPAFEAVSYAWDHTDARLPLLCDGKQLEVSPDVLDMIMTLNLISTVRVFWVDAVCIDQSSTLDKNIQVPRMRFIFSKAQMVWVWLGQGTYESRLAFELLVQMNDLRIDKAQNEIHLAESWLDSLPRYQGRSCRTFRQVVGANIHKLRCENAEGSTMLSIQTLLSISFNRHGFVVRGPFRRLHLQKPLDWSVDAPL